MHRILALLLCAAAISGAAADGVVTYSIPAFNASMAAELLAGTNSAIYAFEPGHHYAAFDRAEGFLLLPQRVRVWRAGADGQPAREASFNTSFTYLAGRRANVPVAFVVLLDSIPAGGSLRGEANYTASASSGACASGVAAVQVGPVMSYGRYVEPDVGLNVTVTPCGAAALAVWVEYDAGAHTLSVYVAAAGQPKPSKALLDAPLDLVAECHVTETAYTGFFTARIRDVIVGVRDWNLVVEKVQDDEGSVGNGKKSTSWKVVLLAVLGSMVAASSI